MSATLALKGAMPRERAAVSALFLANGYVVGSWAPKIPLFKADLGIDEGVLGLMILAFGIGSLADHAADRGGDRARGVAAGGGRRRAGAGAAPPLLTLMPGPWTAAAVLVLLGGLVGGMDVAMNANAVAVERRMGRAIMSSCHAWWSVGALVGAATGGVLIGALRPARAFGGGLPRDARGGRGGGGARCWPMRRRRRSGIRRRGRRGRCRDCWRSSSG